MIEYIILILVFVTFILASIEDIKKREVYDYLNYSFVFFVLSAAIFHSIYTNSIDPIKYAGFGLLIGFAIGSLIYYAGIWGGGDAKFLLGFSASSYYLINFANQSTSQLNVIYNYSMEKLQYILTLFIESFLDWILTINTIFLFIAAIHIFIRKDSNEKKDIFILFSIILLLTSGLYFKVNSIILLVLGFIAFLLIYIAEDNIFNAIYIKIKKNILQLKENDKPDNQIKISNDIKISKQEANSGLLKEHIYLINEKIKSNYKLNIRKTIPMAPLIAINFIIYVFKIITLDETNLALVSFLFKFLFFSFLVGGILAIFLIFYYYIKNFKKINISFSRIEIYSMISITTISLFLSIFNTALSYITLFVAIYIFIKMAKQVEKLMFVSKKEIDKIVPGDWIVQDIIIENKTIYSVEDFKLGIEENQLEKIKKLSASHHNLKKILVKDGIAFLPPLFLGFIIMLL